MQKFYRLKNTPSVAVAGPFPVPGDAIVGQLLNLVTPWGFGVVAGLSASPYTSKRRMLWEGGLRGVRFPGVVRSERPARGVLLMPAAADITNHSTLTLDDGSISGGNPAVFEFVSGGGATPGNIEVDISTATTPADVAGAFLTAVFAYTAGLGIATIGDAGPGFTASTNGAGRLFLVQATITKNARGELPGDVLDRLTWFGKTMGAFGNNAIVASVPGEWTDRIFGMSGGKSREAGIVARPCNGSRAQCVPLFQPALEQQVELG